MPIILPLNLTTPEIRVLQEFRRLNTETLPLATITALKHPTGGGEAPAVGLVGKGFLETDAARENFSLTPKAKDFLSHDPKPLGEETGDTAASAGTDADADGA